MQGEDDLSSWANSRLWRLIVILTQEGSHPLTRRVSGQLTVRMGDPSQAQDDTWDLHYVDALTAL
jgi:hypothetical protein